jgi:hypothetical protein
MNNNETQLNNKCKKCKQMQSEKKMGKKVRKCIRRWVMMLEGHEANVMKEVTMALECC